MPAFKPKGFLAIAKELDKGNTETHYRSIINRSYYAAFGTAKLVIGNTNLGLSVHREIIDSLKNSVDDDLSDAGWKLETLFNKRKRADYNYRKPIAKHESDFALTLAEEIIMLLK